MCVLLVHHRVRPDAPVVLLANRDESYARAFDPPALRPGPAGIVAPRDRAAGGTWLGVNAHGLVAAITNRPAKPGQGVRSRGLLVADVLERDDVPAARAWLDRHLAANRYDPFNLMVLDRAAGFVLHHERERSTCVDLAPGVHVLTNLHDLDVVPVPEEGALRVDEPLSALIARLERLAGDTTTPLPGDHRINKRGTKRGTVCSAVVVLRREADAPPIFRFAPGSPDVTSFEEVRVPARVESMAAWRAEAIARFPDLRDEIEDPHASTYDLFRSLRARLREACEAEDRDALRTIFAFAAWSLEQEEEDVWNAAAVSFYENLFDDEFWDYRQMVFAELTPRVAREVWVLWAWHLPEDRVDEINRRFPDAAGS